MVATKTTFRPILFSTPMVQAILENRKTMTRRTKGLESINEMPENYKYIGISTDDDDYKGCHYFEYINYKYPPETYNPVEPVMNVGDVLWVRETFREIEQDFGEPRIEYKATEKINLIDKWKPSIFMPKRACRIFLKIKSIRVERLQDISEEDIKNEGVQLTVDRNGHVLFELGEKCSALFFAKNISIMSQYEIWKTHWAALWCKINGDESFKANPYVFVYEFEQIEKPLNFL